MISTSKEFAVKQNQKNGVVARDKQKVNKQIMQEIGKNNKRINRRQMCFNRLVK